MNWFNMVVSSASMETYILAAIIAMLAIRNLLYPFLKAGIVAGSDMVKSTYEGNDSRNFYHSVSGSLPPSVRNRKKLPAPRED